MRGKNDGGYYAIKGFEYQIDKTILEILDATNQNDQISLENIQDISSGSYVVQVKYKETQNFSPSKIKAPVVQLMEEFRQDSLPDYILYAYFKDIQNYKTIVDANKKISKESLDLILGDSKVDFTDYEKISFIEKFFLDFAPTFQEQFSAVIIKLKDQIHGCNSVDEAVFLYSNLAEYLRKLVIENSNSNDRQCTKKQALEYIQAGRKIVFDSAFKIYKGEREYIKFVKTKFIKPKKNQENYIFLGNIDVASELSIGQLIAGILSKWYKDATYDIKPFTFVVADQSAIEIKKCLIREEMLFNDGYENIEFNEKIFYTSPLVTKKVSASTSRATDSLSKISFKLRLLSRSKFDTISDRKITPAQSYFFDAVVPNDFNEFSIIKIDGLNTRGINEIFTF